MGSFLFLFCGFLFLFFIFVWICGNFSYDFIRFCILFLARNLGLFFFGFFWGPGIKGYFSWKASGDILALITQLSTLVKSWQGSSSLWSAMGYFHSKVSKEICVWTHGPHCILVLQVASTVRLTFDRWFRQLKFTMSWKRMYLWWSLCTLYLYAQQVRITIGDSGLCCTCVTDFGW